MTQRVISVFLPRWPTDRLARLRTRGSGQSASRPDGQDPTPIVMVGRVGRRRAVAHMNLAAAQAGLRIGQAVAHATALVPGLELHALDADGDQIALHRLALWVQRRYSPIVAVDGADGLVVDATGCAHLFGGEENMLIDLRGRLAKAGYGAKLAIADSWGGAHALARFAQRAIFVVAPGATGREISPLPAAALRLPADQVLALCRLGLETIGELEARPRGPLAHRFGLALIARLDQAFARQAEPIEPVIAAETLRVSRVFAEPISAPETMARYLALLTDELCAALEAASLGAVRLDAFFFRTDNRIQTVRIGLAKPMRQAQRLARLLCDKLENVDPGFGVEKLLLAAPGAEPLAYQQAEALADKTANADLSGLVDTLSNRLGHDHVYRLATVASDIPERSVRKAPALDAVETHVWPSAWLRPTRLFRSPEPIDTLALLPDAPPAWFSWRGVRRQVRRADGPERVFGEWWKADAELARSRDYFQVEDDSGALYWIFRDGDGADPATGSQRWFMHGVFG